MTTLPPGSKAATLTQWPRRRPFQLLSRVRTLCDEIFVRLMLGVRDEQMVQRATVLVPKRGLLARVASA